MPSNNSVNIISCRPLGRKEDAFLLFFFSFLCVGGRGLEEVSLI